MKSRRIKSLMLLILFVIIATSFGGLASANTTNTNNISDDYIIGEKDALNVAYNFIVSNIVSPPRIDDVSDLKNHSYQDTATVWKEGLKITECTPMYGLDDHITAYMIEMGYENGQSAGYIIVNTDKRYAPIVEFSFNQEPFLNIAQEEIAAENIMEENPVDYEAKGKLYYLGGFEYGIGMISTADGTEDYYDLSAGIPVEKEKADINLQEIASDVPEDSAYLYEWDDLLGGGSNPPVGEIIYIPGNYESEWEDCAYDWCYGMGSSYFAYYYPGFWGPDNCGPTAGTNVMKYWTLRDPGTFSDLYNGSWAGVHNELYDLMGTESSVGTYVSHVGPALCTYVESYCSTSPNYYLNWFCTSVASFNYYIKNEINNGRPVVLLLCSDAVYTNHFVVGFGYIRYKYSGIWSSHYVMLADGWSYTPNRYIHYQTGRSYMDITRLNPY